MTNLKILLFFLICITISESHYFPFDQAKPTTSEEAPVSSQCQDHVQFYIDQLTQYQTGWALKSEAKN